jgi:hypothetical protein
MYSDAKVRLDRFVWCLEAATAHVFGTFVRAICVMLTVTRHQTSPHSL